jgi:hypothetical protein
MFKRDLNFNYMIINQLMCKLMNFYVQPKRVSKVTRDTYVLHL